MDLNLLKKLLTSTEVLGVDAQPLRDYITAFQAGQVSQTEFKHLLLTLSNIINTHKFAPNSQPVQVQMLLQQLKQALQKKKDSQVDSVEAAVPSDINMHLLNALLDLKSEMKNLKEGIPQPQVITQVIQQSPEVVKASDTPQLGPVFVNPLDETREIKGSVNIESKTESGIGNKLNRLKELKRGGS